MLRKLAILMAVVMAALVAASVAFAATLDPATGTGFVGKGEVQTAFGWNNKQLQKNASGVTFTYESVAQYAQSCMKDGEKKTQFHTFKDTRIVNATIAYDARVRNQITGFNLNGYNSGGSGEPVPTDLCNPGNDANNSGWVPDLNGEYPEVTQTDAGTATLYVNYGGLNVPLAF